MKKWLIAIRKEKGLSQVQVSEAVGISPPSYCNIENGERGIAVETAKKIANVLGFDWTRFYEDEETQHKAGQGGNG